MPLAFPKVKLNDPATLKIEVGLCCMLYHEVQRHQSLKNVRLVFKCDTGLLTYPCHSSGASWPMYIIMKEGEEKLWARKCECI